MADTPTLVRFVRGYVRVGDGPDGLPLYEETINVIKERPPYLQVEAVATEADYEENPHPWKLFQQEEKGRLMAGEAGYPLAMWPVMSPAEIRMCADREIYTVESLAKLAARGAQVEQIPAQILEAAKRAAKMVELSKKTGKHEARIHDLESQIIAVREENNELKATVESQRITIQTMAARNAA